MKLKDLIQILKSCPQDLVVPLGFSNPHSWRGVYSELAFEPKENTKISDMLSEAESAIGETYTGYKGGDFTMDESTRVHFSDWGSSEENAGEIFSSLVQALLALPELEQ